MRKKRRGCTNRDIKEVADGGEEELAKKVPEEIDYKGEKEGNSVYKEYKYHR